MSDLNLQYRLVAELIPSPSNPRTHSKRQIRQIADSIRAFGFTNPVLIDGEGAIVAGHGRVEAAKLLGMETVPTVRLGRMSEAERRAYIIADNRLAEQAGWDEALLAIELQYLVDLDFDVELTGFEMADIDLILSGAETGADDGADQLPDLERGSVPVSRPGDLWHLGEHRLLCGDATKGECFAQLLAGVKAQMVFVDPPYNVPIDGHVCGSGAIKHPNFAMASGEMSEAEFTGFLKTVLGHLAAHSLDGAIHFVCMDWRHMYELLIAGRSVYTDLKNLCVWSKDNGGMGSLYRSKHELIFVFKHGTAPHINNVELGRHGRNRTNVWEYAGVNSLRRDRLDELRMHPTVKPVALVADAILDCSRRGGIVFDCFAGSGTTLIAAEKTGRHGHAMEIDPGYVDTAVRRWEAFTGVSAVHAETDLCFAEMGEQRHRDASADTPSCAGSEEALLDVA